MPWIDLISLLAVLQYFAFGALVGRARVKYRIHAPATSGDENFERWFRVQQNTLELLIMFFPALWVAARYWSPGWMAVLGLVYLIGRVVYLISYVREPKSRELGFILSIAPIGVLILFALVGVVRSLI
ncbi:MAG: MAPEG family protein [Proteobacteria bacterium]|nr:MAPEG family protein [Pseudomonadota bacterium]